MTLLDDRVPPLRLWLPIASTVAGSAIALLPIVDGIQLLPSFGLLIALGWRLLRPELWSAWIALPLGLADDLLTGAPLGSAMIAWPILFIVIDLIDQGRIWHDPGTDWLVAAGACLFAGLAGWAATAIVAHPPLFWLWMPPAVIGAILYPAAARLVARLDRWRLGGAAATIL